MTPKEFRRKLGAMSKAMSAVDYSDELLAGAKAVGDAVQGNFVRGEGPDGSPWPPRKDNLPHPLLRLTETMFRAATDPNDSNATLALEARQVVFGVSGAAVPYAAKHPKGKGVAVRKYLYLRKADAEQVMAAMYPGISKKVMRILRS